jgi:hypothetical protein
MRSGTTITPSEGARFDRHPERRRVAPQSRDLTPLDTKCKDPSTSLGMTVGVVLGMTVGVGLCSG